MHECTDQGEIGPPALCIKVVYILQQSTEPCEPGDTKESVYIRGRKKQTLGGVGVQ